MVNVARGCNVLFKSEEDVTCRSNFVLVMHIYANQLLTSSVGYYYLLMHFSLISNLHLFVT